MEYTVNLYVRKFVYYTDKISVYYTSYGYDRTSVLHGHFVTLLHGHFVTLLHGHFVTLIHGHFVTMLHVFVNTFFILDI